MMLASMLFTLLLIDYGLPKPTHYVFICGFQRCDLRLHWCDDIAGECLSCWRYCNTSSKRNKFAKLCQGACLMYTSSLNHSEAEVLNAGSGGGIENSVQITTHYPSITVDDVTTVSSSDNIITSTISVSNSTHQLTNNTLTSELTSILPSDVIVNTEISHVNSFEILRKLRSKLKLIQIPVIKALSVSVVLLIAILLLTLNIPRINESRIINSCITRIRTSNPESDVIFNARTVTQSTGIVNSACPHMCEMSDLGSTSNTSVKETTV